MCGRFTLSAPGETVAELFELADPPELPARYNIAPTQSVPVVLIDRGRAERCLRLMRWGLIPSWANDPSIGSRLINARAETAASKPAFRAAFRDRRCLVVADGFYEWRKVERRKQPYHIRMRDGAPFGFAGLWEQWNAPDGSLVDSCTVLTTEPNELIQPLHNRMPAIVDPKEFAAWLDPHNKNISASPTLLAPYPAGTMTAYPVSTHVNNPANDAAQCTQPLPPPP